MAIGNVIAGNKTNGLASDGGAAGFGHNTLVENNDNGAGQQVAGELLRADPNACKPASEQCP